MTDEPTSNVIDLDSRRREVRFDGTVTTPENAADVALLVAADDGGTDVALLAPADGARAWLLRDADSVEWLAVVLMRMAGVMRAQREERLCGHHGCAADTLRLPAAMARACSGTVSRCSTPCAMCRVGLELRNEHGDGVSA